MDHFTIPCALRIDTKGVLDIPADAEVVINESGEYAGYVTAEGDIFAHRGLPSDLETYIASFEHEDAPAATAAAQAHAEELGVDLTQVQPSGGTDGTLIVKADVAAAAEGTPDGETGSQQAS